MLFRSEALYEERAATAFDAEECEEDDEECDLLGATTDDGDAASDSDYAFTSDDDDETNSELEQLEVDIEAGGPPTKGRVKRGRSGRLQTRIRTLRRAVEVRPDGAFTNPGTRCFTSNAGDCGGPITLLCLLIHMAR